MFIYYEKMAVVANIANEMAKYVSRCHVLAYILTI